QPLNNVVRVTIQALSAVLGGTQSLHTNGYDEALALPTEQAATLALRTQQIIANESGAALTADPLAGSYYVEHLTNELERCALDLLSRVDSLGAADRARAGLQRARARPGWPPARRARGARCCRGSLGAQPPRRNRAGVSVGIWRTAADRRGDHRRGACARQRRRDCRRFARAVGDVPVELIFPTERAVSDERDLER